MATRSKEAYIKSLQDGRTVYYKGQRVTDVTSHALLKTAVEHAALEYELSEDAQHREPLTYTLPGTQERFSRYFKIPENAEDLLRRRDIIDLGTRVGGTFFLIIKEIGTDCLFALHLISKRVDDTHGTNYHERVMRYYEYCRDNDLAMAVAQTDVKGDRSLHPHQQEHPDYYVRIVDETKDGIVVRGAKAHTTDTVCANELLVIPTRTLGPEDREYAVAFAIPMDTKGLKLIVSPFSHTDHNTFHHPVSARHHLVESLTVFDDVLVPWERVFLKGEWDFAGPLALIFVQFHRFTAVSYKAPLLDFFVGAAELMAEANGIRRAAHVRDKIVKLIAYAETVRALTKAAAWECKMLDGRIAVPDPVITNMAKWYFANNFHQHVAYLQDIAGGLLVTGPSEEDLRNPETAGYITKYLGGKKGISAEDRLKLFNLIRDLAASDIGGYNEILSIHAEGSLEAQKLAIAMEYDTKPSVEFVKGLIGLTW
jgi:4-hydroxybutyryl-CoA dehydratase/vinylacetyl-CoA-Delta-isomerase